AALVAERDAAVHTPRRLLLELVLGEGEIDLLPVADPLLDRTRRPLLALDLEKAGDLTHSWPRRPRRTSARAPRPAPAPRRARRRARRSCTRRRGRRCLPRPRGRRCSSRRTVHRRLPGRTPRRWWPRRGRRCR